MGTNRFNNFTEYGIGIGLRQPHYDHILSRKPVVDWFEIISENFMIDGGRPLQILDQILEQYKVVQHGVSMYFGSAEKPNREHLRRLKELVKRTKTPWLSDHLCWGSVDGRYTHDLLPMPYTFAAAKGQRLQIDGVRSGAKVRLSLIGSRGNGLDLRAGVPLTLPATDRYVLHVDTDTDETAPYTLTLAIR